MKLKSLFCTIELLMYSVILFTGCSQEVELDPHEIKTTILGNPENVRTDYDTYTLRWDKVDNTPSYNCIIYSPFMWTETVWTLYTRLPYFLPENKWFAVGIKSIAGWNTKWIDSDVKWYPVILTNKKHLDSPCTIRQKITDTDKECVTINISWDSIPLAAYYEYKLEKTDRKEYKEFVSTAVTNCQLQVEKGIEYILNVYAYPPEGNEEYTASEPGYILILIYP